MSAAAAAAVAFDCDGTIADTESLSAIAWAETLASRGVVWTPDDYRTLIGRPFAANWDHFRGRGALGDVETFRSELRTRFRTLFDEGLEVHEDAVEAMRAADAQGSAIAVVSSSTRDHIDRVLERAGVAGIVRHIVASGDTDLHKPAPDPYLAACLGLGVEPRHTVAVEDTTTGARSARAAGLWTVAVRRAHAVAELVEHADVVVDHLQVTDLVLPESRRRGTPGPRD